MLSRVVSVRNSTGYPEVRAEGWVSKKGNERTGVDMPARIKNDAEVVATEIDVCAVYDVTTVFDRDAGKIAAFGEVARINSGEGLRCTQGGRART
jgi:hypothetical protein